ncbi:MAG: hypothetical protein MUF61_01675 [archaeon]|nr:hypothetical protein [archaeon]
MPKQTTHPRLEDIIKLEKGKIVSVDWGAMNGTKLSNGRLYEDLNDEVLRFLKEHGFLRQQSKGAFIVLGSDMDLSPSASYGTHYGFNNQKDAEDFARAYYSGTFFGVKVAQLVTDEVHER